MRIFIGRKSTRWIALLLSFLFLFLGLCFASVFRYGMTDLWYHSTTENFADSTQGYTFAYSALAYVRDNFSRTEFSEFNEYGGKAFSYSVYEGNAVLVDTTGENSDFVLSLEGTDGLTFNGYINLPVERYDGCYAEYLIFTTFFPYRYYIMAGMLLSVLLSVILFSVALIGVVAAGTAESLSPLEKIPLDGLALLFAGIYYGLWLSVCFLLSKIDSLASLESFSILVQMARGITCQWLISSWVYIIVYFTCGQLSAKTLRTGSLCYRISRKVTFTGVVIFIGTLHLLVTLVVGVLYRSWSGSFFFPAALVLADILVIILLLVFIKDSNVIRMSIHELAVGDFRGKIRVKHLHFIWKTLGEEINAIGDGLNRAVEEQTRSERMKTELITNVSHDLKTPLTSIINYVDILKKKKLTEEERQQYLDILERQSSALKRLTEDIVEASKAASGALNVNMEILDATEFVEQILGEYAERLENARLEPVLVMPEGSLYILADGRHLCRVMDNLMTNALKYALPGTRLYVELTGGDFVLLSVKNISRDPLNIPPERLMERFVRGDSSRRREGSGLGLSIAKSLTELMNGSFDLSLDGDLFRVDIRFDRQDASDIPFPSD